MITGCNGAFPLNPEQCADCPWFQFVGSVPQYEPQVDLFGPAVELKPYEDFNRMGILNETMIKALVEQGLIDPATTGIEDIRAEVNARYAARQSAGLEEVKFMASTTPCDGPVRERRFKLPLIGLPFGKWVVRCANRAVPLEDVLTPKYIQGRKGAWLRPTQIESSE